MKVKKPLFGFFFLGAMILALVLGSCKNQFLPEPLSARSSELGGGASPWGAPLNLSATQGERRAITLSWRPVAGADRYIVYHGRNPADGFTPCGEATDGSVEFTEEVPPGAEFYYQVRAQNKRGERGPHSAWAKGTSLAQPHIYFIGLDPDDSAGKVRVSWSMNNLETGTYEEKIRYTLYCYEGSANPFVERARIELTDSREKYPFADVSGLFGHTTYKFLVEARLEGSETAVERSALSDVETARRTTPVKPVDLKTVPGGRTDVVLSFKLPEKVEVLDSGGVYVPQALYFVVSRRVKDSGGAFETLCAYLGTDPDKAAPGNLIPGPYTQGDPVSWTDTTAVRGQKYEYRVQSYADGDSPLTAPASIASIDGWAMARPLFSLGMPVYEEDAGNRVAAKLPLVFSHDQKDVPYEYVLHETIRPLGDGHANDAPATVQREEGPFSLAELEAYASIDAAAIAIDLSAPTSGTHRGRGIYRYSVDVRMQGDAAIIENVPALEERRIFEQNFDHLQVEDFTVADGYTDRFVLGWKKKAGLSYELAWADSATGTRTPMPGVAAGSGDDAYTYIFDAQNSGITRYFFISARDAENNQGDIAYSPMVQTLGTPELSVAGPLSYDTIRLTWTPVQKADFYRLQYRYAGDPDFVATALISAADVPLQAGKCVYPFKPLGSNNIDAARAGKSMEIKLEALNRARQLADGGGEVKTCSGETSGRIFGPAGLEQPGAITAAKHGAVDSITVSWKKVDDAAGYYVIRRQYDLATGAVPAGALVKYYVDAAGNIKGKGIWKDADNVLGDSADVSAELTLAGGTYTLKDKALADAAYAEKQAAFGVYADQQNEMPWGHPYRYLIIPVLSEAHAPDIEDDAPLALGGVTYLKTSISPLEKTGRTIGFVSSVRATKGTASSGGAYNDGIKIEWERPVHFSGSDTVKYHLFRKREGLDESWTRLSSAALSATSWEDNLGGTGPVPGTAYEYLVGVSFQPGDTALESLPGNNARFTGWSRTVADEEFAGEQRISGFVLPAPTMVSASRDVRGSEEGGYYETVTWNAAGIEQSEENKNRGIAGYHIQVRDQSADRAWQTIATVPVDEADRSKSVWTRDVYNNAAGHLNVLRDYRHYFRVRAFALAACPSQEPASPALDGSENAWVKWGARQITAKEFAALTSLTIGSALKQVGNIGSSSSSSRNINLNHTPYFQTVSGTLTVKATIGTYYFLFVSLKYVKSYDSYTASSLNFTASPSGVDGISYNGTVKIADLKTNSGTYQVDYNGSNFASIDRKFVTRPFTLDTTWDYALGNTYGAFKDCNGLFNWNETSGWQ